MEPVELAGRLIGNGQPTYVIAEIGVNHDGSVVAAHELIEVAAQAGADAVKFQTFDPDLLASDSAATANYQQRATGQATQRQMLQSLTLPPEAWTELRDHAAQEGLHFLSTPFDLGSAALLADLGVPALKVPSGELTNIPFIRELAEFGLPLLVSTGMSDEAEVAMAVTAAANAPSLALFHCVSQYPAPDAEANLRAIATLRARFGVPTGWSDHTTGSLSAIAATALGATLLEKHITLDRSIPGPDHAASEDPAMFADYVQAVRRTESALGDGVKRPQPGELTNREVVRRAWHATRQLRAGDVLGSDDIVALRPATAGVPPSVPLVGRRLRQDVAEGTPIGPAAVEPDP